MLGDVEVKEIVAEVSSPEEILEIRKWKEVQHAKDFFFFFFFFNTFFFFKSL